MIVKKKLKIVHFTQFLGIGGLEKIIFELSLKQIEQGHDVTVVVYDYERSWVDFFKSKGIKVKTSFKKNMGFDPRLIMKFKSYLHEERFDIVQTHDINPLIYLSGVKLLKLLKNQKNFKLIHTTHTLDHIENSKKIEFFEKTISRIADQIVTVSPRIKTFYIKKAFLSPSKVHLIENGISLKSPCTENMAKIKKLIYEKEKLKADLPLGLCLSRIVPLKDQEFLIKAFLKRPELQLIIVGPPSDKIYFEKLKKLLKDNPSQNVRLLGPRTEVVELNKMTNFYLSASTHEGLPVSVLEAMSLGNPCLVSNISGHKVLNKYEEVVDTYQLGDQKDFLRKLDFLTKNLQKEKYQRGQIIVDKYFSINKMTARYSQVYNL